MQRPNVAQEMGWREDGEDILGAEGGEGGLGGQLPAQREVVEESEEEEEAAAAAKVPLTAAERAARKAARAAAADENEIDLGEGEEEGSEPELDPELLALAQPPAAAEGETGAEGGAEPLDKEAAEEERRQRAARGEPRSWEDLSEDEQEGEWIRVTWCLGSSREV